jgi:hypothetical protein
MELKISDWSLARELLDYASVNRQSAIGNRQ